MKGQQINQWNTQLKNNKYSNWGCCMQYFRISSTSNVKWKICEFINRMLGGSFGCYFRFLIFIFQSKHSTLIMCAILNTKSWNEKNNMLSELFFCKLKMKWKWKSLYFSYTYTTEWGKCSTHDEKHKKISCSRIKRRIGERETERKSKFSEELENLCTENI